MSAEERPKRTVFGKLCLAAFSLFNVIMAYFIGDLIFKDIRSGEDSMSQAFGLYYGAIVWIAGFVVLGAFAFGTMPARRKAEKSQ